MSQVPLIVIPLLASVAFAVGEGEGGLERPKQPSPARIAAAQLGDAQLAGQRIVAGFSGPRPTEAVRGRIRAGRLAGVILFSDNVDSRADARRLAADLQAIERPPGLRVPLLVMLDQEGGLVKRLSGPPDRSAERMGDAGTGVCREQGAHTGRSLRRSGVNVNLAPVLDVGRPGSAMEREHRSFGRHPGRVARCAGAFAAAMERRDVAATAKHFPGIGAASENTDIAVQRLDLSKRTLRRADERPYGRFIGDGARHSLVMLSSAIYPAFSERPAAFSRSLATRELRRRLGFEGVSITDALGTASTEPYGGPAEVARRAARAGIDLMLYADLGDAKRAAKSLRGLAGRGERSRERFSNSVARILDLRASLTD